MPFLDAEAEQGEDEQGQNLRPSISRADIVIASTDRATTVDSYNIAATMDSGVLKRPSSRRSSKLGRESISSTRRSSRQPILSRESSALDEPRLGVDP